ncbi:MAG: bifunctional DNA primase/polymerase [Gemmataceae bacterium]
MTKQTTGPAPNHLDAALAMQRLGWSVIPLCHPKHTGHHPPSHASNCDKPGKYSVRKYKTTPGSSFTVDDLRGFWQRNPGYNVGVVTGRVSGVVMIDLDDEEGEERWGSFHRGLAPPTWEFGTGKGRHLVYSWTYTTAPDNSPFTGHEAHLSFLGEGRMSVMPPSLHRSGVRYVWTRGGPGSKTQLAEWPDELVEAVTGGKHSSRKRQPGGGDLEPSPPRPSASKPAGKSPLERCRAYLAKMGPCDPRPEHPMDATTHLLKAATACVEFDLADDDAVALLSEWDSTNPCGPYPESEYRRKLREAERSGYCVRGSKVATARPALRPTPPTPAPKVSTPAAPPPPPPPPPAPPPADDDPFASAEGVQAADYQWFLPPYIPRGCVTFLVGRPGTGKSTLQGHLASIARKTLFLPGEEDVQKQLAPRLDDYGIGRGRWRYQVPGPNWVFPDCENRMIDALKKGGYDLMVIDPIDDYLGRGFNENESHLVRDLLNSLRRVAEATEACIILCRHVGKQADNVMPGSRAWHAVPRVVVELLHDAGPPETRIIRHFKNQISDPVPSRLFTLHREGGRRPRFVIGAEVNGSDATLAKEVTDRMDRLKIEEATEFLRMVLANGELDRKEVYRMGELLDGFGDRTLDRAADRLGVVRRRVGLGKEHKSYWSLPEAAPKEGGGV